MKENTNFKSVALAWLSHKKLYVKKSTYATYCILIGSHIIPFLGEKCVVKENDVQDFVNSELERGLSLKTVKDILVVLKMILRFGAKNSLFPDRRIDVVFPTQREKADIEVMSVSNQRRLMCYVREHFSFRNLGILICLSSGIRIGEICALRWADIDLECGVIRVSKTIQRIYIDGHTELIEDAPKTVNSNREIPLTRELAAYIRPIRKIVKGEFYLLSNSPTPVEPRTYRTYFRRLTEKLGLPPIRFHGLRHSFATRCIESKCDYKTVSALLGHSNISTTLNLYVHPGLEQKRRCIDAVARLLK
ncbi:MAG: site-specific integrase [Bacteroidales bacterium]|nr:site-specific integrase [Bacteroidales bacterium]